ncbi:MAG: tail-specific protease, partial [Hydrogenophaga sp.]|nr:tail-specific protease [Hydrogenophaga sp.]
MKKVLVLLLSVLVMAQTLFAQQKDKSVNPANGTASASKQPGAVTTHVDAAVMPTVKQEKVNQLITEILTKYHYRKLPLNDSLSSAIFDRYLKTLDFNRVYFLAS